MGTVIQGSVGDRGANNPRDVAVVQTFLNHAGPEVQLGMQVPVTGKCDATTIRAIRTFQAHASLPVRDGRVDPMGHTIRKLVELSKRATSRAPQRSGITLPSWSDVRNTVTTTVTDQVNNVMDLVHKLPEVQLLREHTATAAAAPVSIKTPHFSAQKLPVADTMDVFIVYGGLGHCGRAFMAEQIQKVAPTLFDAYFVALADYSSPVDALLPDLDTYITTRLGKKVKSRSIAGFSAGGNTVLRGFAKLKDYKLVGLIDPGLSPEAFKHTFGSNVKMVYNDGNWGDKYAWIRNSLPVLAKQIRDGGGVGEKAAHGHLEMPAHFFKNYVNAPAVRPNPEPDPTAESHAPAGGTIHRVQSGVKLTQSIRAAFQVLDRYLPSGTEMTSGLRSDQDQARIINDYFAANHGPASITDVEQRRLWLVQRGLKIAKVGTSQHRSGLAFDLSGASLDAMQAAVERCVHEQGERFPLQNTIVERKQNCLHVNLKR